MPHETAVFGGGNHVTGGHGHVQRFNVDVLAVHRCADAIGRKEVDDKDAHIDFLLLVYLLHH